MGESRRPTSARVFSKLLSVALKFCPKRISFQTFSFQSIAIIFMIKVLMFHLFWNLGIILVLIFNGIVFT